MIALEPLATPLLTVPGDELTDFLEQVLPQLVTVSETSFSLEQGILQMQGAGANLDTRIRSAGDEAVQNLEGMTVLSQRSRDLSLDAQKAREAGVRGQNQAESFFDRLSVLFSLVESSSAFMEKLKNQAKTMGELMGKIDDIAEILKVLGINAGIQAAKAGSSGRGFGVVAKEVQLLAARARGSAGEADSIIKNLEVQILDVSSSLTQARSAVKENQALVQGIRGELETIERLNEHLEHRTVDLSRSLDQQSAFAAGMEQVVTGIVDSNEATRVQLDQAAILGRNLHGVVDKVLGLVGSRKLAFHQRCVQDVETIAATLEAQVLRPERLPAVLETFFRSYPYFSLFYVMDGKGIQLHDNVIHPQSLGLITPGGKGIDRSSRPYYQGVQNTRTQDNPVYISDVYVSTATKALCLTAAVKLAGGWVLAADMELNQMLQGLN